ncbi:hypothetical protein NC651_036282 [Populus alba x Populus x berolinensis]|nr:hypothetical protein NC651_036282 [Populus alba x Populus x berolinensis]
MCMEMISKKVSGSMLLIVAFTFMAAFDHSTLAVRLIPPLSDIMYAQGEANCIDKESCDQRPINFSLMCNKVMCTMTNARYFLF